MRPEKLPPLFQSPLDHQLSLSDWHPSLHVLLSDGVLYLHNYQKAVVKINCTWNFRNSVSGNSMLTLDSERPDF